MGLGAAAGSPMPLPPEKLISQSGNKAILSTPPPHTHTCIRARTIARNHDYEKNVRLTSGTQKFGIRSYRDFEV